MAEEESLAYERLLGQGGDRMLREASAFFEGRGPLYDALRRLTERLEGESLSYALLGGLALAQRLSTLDRGH